ncbi:hypothetical protein B0H11DRAFT_1910519 [Mycena galericulata]|nr:hypothetical protein B0H11DRAFT_1910519 [Mycena galericulata]
MLRRRRSGNANAWKKSSGIGPSSVEMVVVVHQQLEKAFLQHATLREDIPPIREVDLSATKAKRMPAECLANFGLQGGQRAAVVLLGNGDRSVKFRCSASSTRADASRLHGGSLPRQVFDKELSKIAAVLVPCVDLNRGEDREENMQSIIIRHPSSTCRGWMRDLARINRNKSASDGVPAEIPGRSRDGPGSTVLETWRQRDEMCPSSIGASRGSAMK